MAFPRPNPWKNVPHVGPYLDDVNAALDPGLAIQWSDMVLYDTFANRPAAAYEGRLFWASDTQQYFRDNGATWDELVPKPPIALIVALGG